MEDIPDKALKMEESISLAAKTVTSVLNAIAGSTALFYVIGFVIVNLYLASHGVRNLEFGKPEYLSAGISFLLVNGLLAFFTVALITFAYGALEGKRHKKIMFVSLLISAMITFASIQSSLLDLMTQTANHTLNPKPTSAAFSWKLLTWPFNDYGVHFVNMVMFMLFAIYVIVQNNNVTNSQYRSKFQFIVFPFCIFFLLTLIVSWTSTIYPRVQPALGGGRPVTIQLLAKNQEAEKILKASGIVFESKLKTTDLELVDENEKSITVLFRNDGAIKLDRALVSSITYKTKSTKEWH